MQRVVGLTLLVLLFGTAAAAATLRGTPGPDLLRGTAARDTIEARAGDDRIVVHYDGQVDTVGCGDGRDVVSAEAADRVGADCEVVSVQLSRDPSQGAQTQPGSQVEPDSFSWGSTVVTAFQSGRAVDGGAALVGWSTSLDAGRTWRSGFFTPGTGIERVSDPVVAYDALHRWWIVAYLALPSSSSALVLRRSRDGLTWGPPIVAAGDPGEDYDKEWIACDNLPRSRFYGRCYMSYLDVVSRELRTRSSTDGGVSWSAPAGLRPQLHAEAVVNGPMPVPRPDGSLVVVYAVWGTSHAGDADHIGAMRSVDGGATFGGAGVIAPLLSEDVSGMRAPPLPSAEIDASGRIYVAWHDCRFRFQCEASDIVLASSADGVSWSEAVRVPTGTGLTRVDYFTPGLGVDVTATGRLAVLYHSRPQPLGCFEFCPGGIDVWLVESRDAGRTWTLPQRLSPESMPMQWVADTAIGRMLGDYVSTSWAGGRAVPVYALATAPEYGVVLRQAIFAASRVTPRPAARVR